MPQDDKEPVPLSPTIEEFFRLSTRVCPLCNQTMAWAITNNGRRYSCTCGYNHLEQFFNREGEK